MSSESNPRRPDDVIGIDVGGTKILAIRVSRTGDVVDRERVVSHADTQAAADEIESTVAALVARGGGVAAVGVGMAGFVDLGGIARSAPNSSGLIGVDLPGKLGRRFGVPIAAENDANCVAVAAAAMMSDPEPNMISITLGTGIGGGVTIGGDLYRGANGFAGEPGHMVVDPAGPECPCGQVGCWERLASGNGLGWIARRAAQQGRADALISAAGSIQAISGEHVTAMMSDGDRAAGSIFEEFAFYVALGVANLIVMFDPAVVVIGGGLAELGEQLIDPVSRIIGVHFPSASKDRSTRLVTAPQGPDAGALGAAILARRLVESREDRR